MGEKLAYKIATFFSAIALILLITNIVLALGNRSLQAEVSARQATLNSGQGYSQLNQSLVQALAEASVKSGDSQIRGLLASQGITVKVNAPDAATDKPQEKK